jgi:peptidoglycan/xylan/chitin deacetylase (PgdA/CDA1 family)
MNNTGVAPEAADSGSSDEAARGRLTDRRGMLRALGAVGGGVILTGGVGYVAGTRMEADTSPASAQTIDSALPPGHQVDVVWAVNTQKKLVALTFDDGPLPRYTPMALDVLDAEKVPATFFMVGKRLIQHAKIVHGRMDRHAIGNHTWGHTDLSPLSYGSAYAAIQRSHAAIAEITGKEAALLRPPYGRLGGTTLHVAAQFGYDVVLWSLLVQDRKLHSHPARMINEVVDNTRPGTILLAHDAGLSSRMAAIRGLPDMIRGLRARGFEFVTVPQLRAEAVAKSL